MKAKSVKDLARQIPAKSSKIRTSRAPIHVRILAQRSRRQTGLSDLASGFFSDP
jgi:hypothetical protein